MKKTDRIARYTKPPFRGVGIFKLVIFLGALTLGALPLVSFSQIYQNPLLYGERKNRVRADSVFQLPIGLTGSNDGKRTSVSLPSISNGYDTAQVRYKKEDSSVYVHTGFQFIKIADNIIYVDTVFLRNDSLLYRIDGTEYFGGKLNTYEKDGLLSGGTITCSGDGQKYYISPSVFRMGGVLYYTNMDSVTLDYPHATLERYEKIILNTLGVDTLVGELSADPIPPGLGANQIELFSRLIIPGDSSCVNANGSSTFSKIYDEDLGQQAEYDAVPQTPIDVASTAEASSGTKSISFTGANFYDFVTLSVDTPIVHKDYDVLTFKIKGTAWGSEGLNIFFTTRTSPTRSFVPVSTPVVLRHGTYNFDTTNANWQYITIPKADFAIQGDSIMSLFFLNVTQNFETDFYLDEIGWQGGIKQPTPGGGNDRWYASVATDVGSADATQKNDVFSINGEDGITTRATGKNVFISGDAFKNKTDSGRTTTAYTTGWDLNKVRDSLQANIDLKLNTADTAGKWVNSITRTAGKDSIIFFIGGTRYAIKDSTGSTDLSGITQTKSGFLPFATSGDTLIMFKAWANMTVSSLESVLIGDTSPSITYQLYHNSDRTNSGTALFTASKTCTSTTTGCSDTSTFSDNTIASGEWVWIVVSAQSGVVRGANFTLNFSED